MNLPLFLPETTVILCSVAVFLLTLIEDKKAEALLNARSDELASRIAALADKSHADSDLLSKSLSERMDRHVSALTENSRAESAKAEALLNARSDELHSKIATFRSEGTL